MSRVRGPTSALTEFLKERGIRAPASSRYQRIERPAEETRDDAAPARASVPAKRRIAPGASMNFDEEDDEDDEDDEDVALPTKAPKTSVRAGERVVCGRCTANFSATRYTRVDPALGPLCPACKGAVPKPASEPKTTKRGARKSRNVVETKPVIPTLQSLSIDVIAQHIDRMHALGNLSARNLDAISKVISKNRRVSDKTIQLFLARDTQRLALYDCSAVTTDAFQTVPMFAPNIHTLILHYCGQLDNAAFSALSKLPLTELDLYGPYLVRKEAWLTFLQHHGHLLRSLKLRETPRFDRACIEALIAHAPHLSELGLAQIGGLDDGGAEMLAQLRHLTYLDLSQPGVSAPGVPPASLHSASIVPILAANAAHLAELRLDYNASLSDEVAEALRTCSALRVLHMEGAGIASDAWAACFRAMPSCALEEVALGHCGLEDDAVAALIDAAPHLRSLSVKNNDALTCAAFDKICAAAPPLRVLEVSFVRCIDDALLRRLASSVPTLEVLYIFGCNQVTPTFQSDALTIIGRERMV
ncbi:hypothetical protein CBS9595_003008 [Malassezia furfur]|nr:hypothetical protein CBS9595_003008 [Malassezia furfur]